MNFDRARALIKRFRYEIIAVFFTAYGMYLRARCLAGREHWADECFSLQALEGPLKPFWQRFHYTDFTFFPGDYIINWPFAYLFKTDKWGVAIPHILLTLLGFYLLYLICRRYFHSIFAWIVTFALVAVHRDLIFHAFELRPYGVLPTFALLAFYFTEEIFSKHYSLSLARKILIGFSFLFTVIYQVYGAIILFFIFVYFALRESGERSFIDIFKRNYRLILTLLIMVVPLYLWYSVGSPHVYKTSGYSGRTFDYIPNPAVDFFAFVKSNFCNLTGNRVLYPLMFTLIFPFILPYPKRLQQIGFLLVLIILPIMVIFYVNLLIGYHILQRQFTWAMPLFAFLSGWCLDSFIGFMRQEIGKQNF
jgi:4-amino-4-deoxy-L-arabinose transferase-like glycosyltransferase